MKKFIQQSLLLGALLFLVSSCLDIQESIYMRDNGSGKFALTVNLENMESLLQLIGKYSKEGEGSKDILANSDINFDDLKEQLEKQPGISKVKTIQENNSKLLGIAFEFDDVNALNHALQEINDQKSKTKRDYFSYSKGQLIRFNTLGIKDHVQREIDMGIDLSIDGVMLGGLLKEMTYTTKYTFERPVRKTSNPGSKITNEGRTVSLTYHFFDEDTQTNHLENNISF